MNEDKNISLIITAAGTGTRFGDPQGKSFTLLGQKPLIIYTCEQLLKHKFFKECLVTIEETKITELNKLFKTYNIPKFVKIIAGGQTRKESVKNAFDNLLPCKYVFIHDGARPNISSDLIISLAKMAPYYPAVIPGIPVVDTLKKADKNNLVEATVDRADLYQIQTPQAFHYDVLKKAYNNFFQLNITDEATLIEHLKYPVKIIPGDKKNIKITYPEDLLILTYFLNHIVK
jgi:2-C-methyl-D-erythritol 4-phosphate cytidylyltransferase